MKVLVTDGDTRAALAVTRSLGRAGYDVFVGERQAASLAQSSRYGSSGIVYPDPAVASDDFVEYLARRVREHGIDVIVPVADVTTLLLTEHRDRFEPRCRLPFGSATVVARAADKVDIVQTAARIGIPIPRSVVVASPADLPEIDFGYPMVVKSRRSRVRTAEGWVSSAVSFAAGRDALLRDLASRPAYDFPLLVQERIQGPGMGIFACYQQGRAVALFSHRRIRERPPWGGVSVLCESVPLDPFATDCALRLLNEIGWQGVAMVEFKRDERDGLPKLMEINGRFWGSLQLAVDAGIDFPALLVRSLESVPIHPPSYRTGVRSRWLWGDLDSLLLVLVGRAKAMGAERSRWRAVRDFCAFIGRDLCYENPRREDLGPWWYETRQRLGLKGRPHLTVTNDVRPPPGASVHARGPRPRRAGLDVTLADSLETVGLDEAAWNALVRQSDTNTVFQTHQWTKSWSDTFSPGQEALFAVASNGSGPLGVAPLTIERGRFGRRVLRFLSDRRADYCDIIAGPRKAEVVPALIDALVDRVGWDSLVFGGVPAHSRTIALVQAVCARRGLHALVTQQCVCPTLLIDGREEEARRLKDRPSMRRRFNHFRRAGALTFRDITSHEELRPYLDCFFAQHIRRWERAGTPSLFLDRRNVEFYRSLAGRMAASGWLLFSVVELDGRPIAFHYGFDYNGSLIWYKPSFDVEHAQHSPGLVMMGHLIGYAVDHRRKELDFTVGDEPFKRRFTNHVRANFRIQVFRGAVPYALERSRRGAAAHLRRLTVHDS